MKLLPRSRLLALASVAGLSALLAAGVAATPAYAEGTIVGANNPDAVPGSYIVVLHEDAAQRNIGQQAAQLASRHSAEVGFVYDAAITGFSATMSDTQARRLAAHPAVDYVEQDARVELLQGGSQVNPPSWGLDRIDQRNRPLNNRYTYPNAAPNVNIYILDTGVRRAHTNFGGRAFTGFDAITPGGNAEDCHGHGTHVAGTAAGSTFGVAKSARIFSVRVLNCAGGGTTAQIVAGINWVTNNAVRPAVANMSLGGNGNNVTMNNAVANSISRGITYAVAAGNSNSNACNFSPARVSTAITVGSTTSTDARSSFSNFGTCVNIFAPGSSINSAWHTSNTATRVLNGTSMASPHAAGVAAQILQANPNLSPAQVRTRMINNSTTGVISNPGTGSPNRLLFSAV